MNIVFYEIEHGVSSNHFLLERNTNHSFPLHMHRCYEMVLMLEGEMKMQIDKEVYFLEAGDLILVKPNRLHSYETQPNKSGICLLCVFSADLIAAISEPISKYRLHTVILHDVPMLYRDVFAQMKTNSDMPTVKGFLYLLCALFYRQVDYTTEDVSPLDTTLLHEMFMYIENNACYLLKNTDKSVFTVAMECGYATQSSFNRSFKQLIGLNPNEYRTKFNK